MNIKLVKVLSIIIVLTSLLSINALPYKTYANSSDSTPRIYVDPPEIIDETLTPNITFTIAIKLENVPLNANLVGVQFRVSWDPTVLECIGMEEILYHNVTPPEEWGNIWRLGHLITDDHIEYAYTWMDMTSAFEKGYAPISGNHTVATITLKVKGIGATTLQLSETILGDIDMNNIPHVAKNGYFRNAPPPLPALIYIDPPKIFNLSLTPCKNFTINVNIENATNVYSIRFKLGFNSTIINAKEVTSGDFIPPYASPNIKIDNVAGYVEFYVSLGASISGNGTIAVITFHVEGLGRTTLDLFDVELLDETGQPLSYYVSGGSFNNVLLAKLAVKPEEIIDPSLLPPATFTINVTISDVEDLYGYSFNLTFDPEVLICVQAKIHDVLNETNYIPNQIIDNIKGFVYINVEYYPPAVPLDIYPPTPLVTILFRVKGMGSSNLTFSDTSLTNSEGQPIPHEAYGGFFQSLIRDIALLSLTPSPTETYEGWEINLTIVAKNEGNITESFSVNIYCNDTLVATLNFTDVDPGQNATLIYIWDTEGILPGNYSLWAEVPPVPYEIDTTDNILPDGFVKLRIMGDINGDDIVNILDATAASFAFGTRPGLTGWNPACDLNGDNVINILDIIQLSRNFGRRI